MTKEEQLLKNRFLDLANTTYQRSNKKGITAG